MGRLFGTDGIRAKAGQFPLDSRTIPSIGQAIGEHLGGPVIVGRDPRESSPWILRKLSEGLKEAGAVIDDGGVLPTPAVALLTQQTRASGGIMISASHNSFEDNGIKVFQADGQKLDDSDEARIEDRTIELVRPKRDSPQAFPEVSPGTNPVPTKWVDLYTDLLRQHFPTGSWLKGRRILVDCANGAMSTAAPSLLESLGAHVETIHACPSGRNINADCGATNPKSLMDAVRKNGFDLGVAYDGDGDRSMFVSSSGRLIDGDAVLLVMSRVLSRTGTLTPAKVIGTSMTNYSLERLLGDSSIELVRVDVGDRYVFREMLASGAVLGGEPSGHVIFSDYHLSGDGLLTTLKLLEAMVEGNDSLDALTEDWKPTPQLLWNIRVAERLPLESLPGVAVKITEIEQVLRGKGRIVVRYSGTEPLLRIMIESDSEDRNRSYAEDLVGLVQSALSTRP